MNLAREAIATVSFLFHQSLLCRLPDLLHEQGITHLLVTGVTTEICVQTTMREANDRGFECLMVEDATESYFPEFKQSTLAMMTAQGGIIGWMAPAANVLQALEVLRVVSCWLEGGESLIILPYSPCISYLFSSERFLLKKLRFQYHATILQVSSSLHEYQRVYERRHQVKELIDALVVSLIVVVLAARV